MVEILFSIRSFGELVWTVEAVLPLLKQVGHDQYSLKPRNQFFRPKRFRSLQKRALFTEDQAWPRGGRSRSRTVR